VACPIPRAPSGALRRVPGVPAGFGGRADPDAIGARATVAARMDREALRALQAPLKQRYRDDPEAGVVTLRAEGSLGDGVACRVETGRALVEAGLHPATGGTGREACSGDMLLEALVACAGVTLSAVATSLGLPLRGGRMTAEGDLDFRGTLGVSKEAPVGFRAIRLAVELDSEATPEERRKLLELTERYCVVYQTLRGGLDIRLTEAGSRAPAD